MKQSNRKPLFLALALTFAAPLAFAQSTTPQSTTPPPTTTDTQSTTQSQPTQDANTTQSTSTQSTTTQDTSAQTQGTSPYPTSSSDMSGSTAAQSTTGPQKKNWSDLDLDKNGSLSATEAAPVNSLSKAFSTADANADGQLTQDEYKAYLAASGKEKVPGSGR
ncbi:MAG TPA: hypothetical protein VMS49_07560 [Lysobacter sp.]|jgi:cytoskeletal protein RodZ|nr:hypothetical protein [Lysobacter sp.]